MLGQPGERSLLTDRTDDGIVDRHEITAGGHVRVVVITDEDGKSNLSFEYPDGPVTPRPEKLPEPRRAKKRRSSPRRKPPGGNGPGGGGGSPPRRGSVPKVPLVKV